MKLFYEYGIEQIRKKGEELCGDSIAFSRRSDSVTMALSDGLGSGVKANILGTLTTQIAMHMLENDLPLGDVVQTLTETLPVDTEREMAYSTFAIAEFFTPGNVWVFEFDTPHMIFVRENRIQTVPYEDEYIEGKKIQHAELDLQEGDWIIFVSDGVLNAGIGGVYPLGWGWDQAARYIGQKAHDGMTAEQFAEKIANTVDELYAGNVGDDVSVIVIKVRKKLFATVLTGPPEERKNDINAVKKFLERSGKHAVCGGTTAKIVARHLGKELEVDLSTMTGNVPPFGRIDGIDLVTEGILTLTRVSGLLKSGTTKDQVKYQNNGAANLIRLLLDTDSVSFLVGQAVNPAHQNPELPHQLGIRQSVVREVADELRKRGKEVRLETV
jgi:hypothetical protein